MKVILIILLTFVFSVGLMGQSGFIRAYDESVGHSADFMDVVIDDDTIVLYSLAWDSTGKQGIRFAKLDTLGNVLQETMIVDSVLTLTTTYFRKKILRTTDGGYAIFGSAGLPTAYLLKVNHELEMEFIVKYTDPNGASLLNTTLLEVDDGFLLVGKHVISTEHNFFIIKTDEFGNEIWRRVYDKEAGVDEIMIEIKKVGEGFLLMGSRSNDLLPAQSTWGAGYLMFIDAEGNEAWSWTMDKNLLPAGCQDGYMLTDSSWIFTSGTWEWDEDNGQYASRLLVFRLDKDKNIVWQKVIGDLWNFQWFNDLERTQDGDFIASGNLWREYAEGVLFSRAVHYKFTEGGDSLWMRQDSVLEDAWVFGTDLLTSGSIISVGYTDKYGAGGGRFGFVMKIGADGCIDTLNCWPVATTESVPQVTAAVFPNPVNEVLTVSIPETKAGYIYFYDGLGRFLRKQVLERGDNRIKMSDLPKGMIFYEVWDTQRKILIGRGKLVKV